MQRLFHRVGGLKPALGVVLQRLVQHLDQRWRVVLISLAVGALIGAGVAVWMHLSQETDVSSTAPIGAVRVTASARDNLFARRTAQPGD